VVKLTDAEAIEAQCVELSIVGIAMRRRHVSGPSIAAVAISKYRCVYVSLICSGGIVGLASGSLTPL
jgi:hypothetical protein